MRRIPDSAAGLARKALDRLASTAKRIRAADGGVRASLVSLCRRASFYTLDEFAQEERARTRRTDGEALQVMPWPAYGSLTDHDLRAIYDYLSSIPAIDANTCGVPSETSPDRRLPASLSQDPRDGCD
jgi:hypothetical protein